LETVGIALAGGGALGFAHVGVLLELEERGIPIDYIAGTSIGSVIGALYAAGYTAEELLELTREINWSDLFTDKPKRRSLPYDERRQDTMYSLTLGFRNAEPMLGSGVSTGQSIVELLDRLLSRYAVSGSFDRFPRPLRVVATNLVTGEEMVFAEGDLKTAVRASMAVPGAFTPVDYRGDIYIDGGWTNSLPVDRLSPFEPTHVIAVRLGTLASADELQSAPAVLDQSSQILRHQRITGNLEHADIVISPDVSAYTAASFDAALELVEIGREAAKASSEALQTLADRFASGEERQSDQSEIGAGGSPSAEQDIYVDRITFSEDAPTAATASVIRTSLMGRTTTHEIRERVYQVYESGEYRFVTYRILPSAKGASTNGSATDGRADGRADSEPANETPSDRAESYTIDIQLALKARRTTLLQAGFSFRSDLWSATAVGFMSHWNWLLRDIAVPGSRWSTSVWVGESFSAATAFRYPLGPSSAITASVFSLNRLIRFYEGRHVSSVYLAPTVGARVGAISVVLDSVEVWLEGVSQWSDLTLQTGGALDMAGEGFRVGLDLAGRADTLDRFPYPRRGTQTDTGYRLRFLPTHRKLYHTAAMSQRWYVPLFQESALMLEAKVGTDFDSGVPRFEAFAIGGLRSFHGLYTDEVSGNHLAAAAAEARIKVLELPLLAGQDLYLTIRGDVGRAWMGTYRSILTAPDLLAAFSVGLDASTIIGRAGLAVGITIDGRVSAGIAIGNQMGFPGTTP
jgi:NTE family protein